MGVVAVLVAVTGWSFTNTLIKLSSQPALAFALYRLWIGAFLLLAVLHLAGRRLTRQVIRDSAPGGALLGIEIAFFFSAIKYTSVADVMVIGALQPALTLLVAGRLFGERVAGRDVAWTIASVGGVALVAVGSSGTPVWSLRGDLLAAGSLVAWTAYFLASKHARATVPALEYITIVTVTAALVITPMALVSGQRLGGLHGTDALFLALFVVGASSGHLMVAWAHRFVDVSVSSLLMLAQPVVASLAALVVLGETITPLEIGGGLVVVGSLAAIVSRVAKVGVEPELAPTETPPL